MNDCTSCHLKREGAQDRVVVMVGVRVVDLFSHTEHAHKTGKNECTGCHVNAKVDRSMHTPLPAMADCTSCHDGDQAFDALGSGCRRCHESAQIRPPAPMPVEMVNFSHLKHADRNVVNAAYGCTDCHASTERGRLFFPGGGRNFDPKGARNGHWPCEKCHQNQFLTRENKGVLLGVSRTQRSVAREPDQDQVPRHARDGL